MKKIALFIMTYKGLQTLKVIIKNPVFLRLVDYVVIGKDKNTINDYSEEIAQLCINNGINFYYKEDNIPKYPDYLITVSWRWLIKNCSSKIIVLHESLLPKYRGFAPLVNQLINNEKYIGVTAIFGEEDYDTGDIICQKKIKINYPIKINEAIIKISNLYKVIIEEIFNQIIKYNQIKNTIKQNEKDATYSLWRDKFDYKINWEKSSNDIIRFINSVGFPYEGASTYVNNKLIKIIDAEIIPDVKIENRDFGKVIFIKKNKPVVVCGQGLIMIKEAYYYDSGKSIFPLKQFRLRFK